MPSENSEGKNPTRYRGLALRIAVNAYFRFLNQFFAYKIDKEKVSFLVMTFGQKTGFLDFTAKRTTI